MHPVFRILSFTILIGASFSARAHNALFTPQYDACARRAVSTTDMVECAIAETSVHDKRLNAAYASLMHDADAQWKSALQDAQRAWLKFREANCAALTDQAGGTMGQVERADCFARITAERANELEAMKTGN